MKIGFGHYQIRIGLENRSDSASNHRGAEEDRTAEDLAILAQAEREYHDTLWKSQSILGGFNQ